uniref:COPI associated protein n=1 Tax=Neobodo designis TaxID=312471 RepID=A0A7S1M507_NEODS|mmetsp:Transcript_344/g.1347  ORF Transcript_344/g.1347 Transcript_344/m.1347 type:complete len:227 (+) Transcript_344:29-709(+)
MSDANATSSGGGGSAVDPNEAQCKCDRNIAVQIMCGMGMAACVLVILNAVLSLMTLAGGVPGFILDVYLCILALAAFLAEMRIFRAIRGLIFNIIKFVYFLTSCNGRGAFYFFIGSVSFRTDNGLSYVTCAVTCAVGVLLVGLNCYFKFPVYVDPQVAKMQAEARLKWERDEANRKLTAAGANASATATAAAGTATAAAQNFPQAQIAEGHPTTPKGEYNYQPPNM